MHRAPRDPRRGIFTRPVVTLMLVAGAWAALTNLILFWWLLESGRDEDEAMAMTFVSLVLTQFWNAFNFRSDRLSAFSRPFANHWLDLAILWELSLLVLIVYVPFLQDAFGTFALSAQDWGGVIALSLTILPVIELAKWAERHGWLGALR
jgi:Ca2+-transporting ATPase